jgi:hypothetical protein
MKIQICSGWIIQGFDVGFQSLVGPTFRPQLSTIPFFMERRGVNGVVARDTELILQPATVSMDEPRLIGERQLGGQCGAKFPCDASVATFFSLLCSVPEVLWAAFQFTRP